MLNKKIFAQALFVQDEFKKIIMNMNISGAWRDYNPPIMDALNQDIEKNKYEINVAKDIDIRMVRVGGRPPKFFPDILPYSCIVFVIEIGGIDAIEVKLCKHHPDRSFLEWLIDCFTESGENCSVESNYRIPKSIIKVLNDWSDNQVEAKKKENDNCKKEENGINAKEQLKINEVGDYYKLYNKSREK